MSPVQLKFKCIAEIADGSNSTLITLVDNEEKYAINAVCDKAARYQLALRSSDAEARAGLLPEVLCSVFKDELAAGRFCVIVRNIEKGKYIATLYDMLAMRDYPIRFEEGVLLSRIVEIPIYMHPQLFARQRTPYDATSTKTCLPLNVISTDKVKAELDKAIDTENYRWASILRDELRRRGDAPQTEDEDE